MQARQIIDPHHHFWDLDTGWYGWLCQPGEPVAPIAGSLKPIMHTYLLEDYKSDTKRWEIVGDVHLEALASEPLLETRWLQKLHDETGWPTVMVAGASLEHPDVETLLAAHAENQSVRGIRQVLNWHQDRKYTFVDRNDLLMDPLWLKGYSHLKKFDFSFDLQLYPHQMEAAAKVAKEHPGTPMILNHTGMPLHRDQEGVALWQAGMRALAAAPNTSVKISGLGMVYPDWNVDGIRPFVRETIDIFGVHRTMFASNFPVERLYATFDQIYDAFLEIVSDMPDADQQRLFHDNAKRVYRI